MEPASELVEQVLNNRAKVDRLADEQDKLRSHERDEKRRIAYDVYSPQIRELENQRDNDIKKLHDNIAEKVEGKGTEIVELMEVVHRVKRIMDYLCLDSTRDLELHNARSYQDRQLEDLGYIVEDKYLKARLFIVENRKPVNKYTLVVVGKCLFYEELLMLTRSYDTELLVDGIPQLEVVLKDAPQISILKEWLEKNRGKILKKELADYTAVKDDYDEVMHQYKIEEFEQLIQYRCPVCNYFYSVLDRISYREPVKCPRDRTEMIKLRRFTGGE